MEEFWKPCIKFKITPLVDELKGFQCPQNCLKFVILSKEFFKWHAMDRKSIVCTKKIFLVQTINFRYVARHLQKSLIFRTKPFYSNIPKKLGID